MNAEKYKEILELPLGQDTEIWTFSNSFFY